MLHLVRPFWEVICGFQVFFPLIRFSQRSRGGAFFQICSRANKSSLVGERSAADAVRGFVIEERLCHDIIAATTKKPLGSGGMMFDMKLLLILLRNSRELTNK